jgi:hypothetical protein
MSEGCKYCCMGEDGDIPYNRKNLIEHKVGNLFGQDIWLTGVIYNNKLSLTRGMYVKDFQIKYCPMCGRKL